MSMPMRSIVDSHPMGANRSCAHDKIVRDWLPKTFRSEEGESKKHIHLLLAVSDNQLAFLINWLAIAFTFNYLPSHRVLIHFSCHGHLSRHYVENYLLSECQRRPQRLAVANETTVKRIIKDRLGSLLEIVNGLDETDAGAMTFDLDAIWVRNMVPAFDHLSATSDFIAQGVIQDHKWGGRVITNFGGVYIKNSPAGKALCQAAMAELNNAAFDPDMPDQDTLSRALFDLGSATQAPLPEFASITKTSEFSNDACTLYPDTCTHIASGVSGTYSLPDKSAAAATAATNITGRYMFLPQMVAPIDCSHICSSSTLLFQHCGIARCVIDGGAGASGAGGGADEVACAAIPEFILTTSYVHDIVVRNAPPVHKFKQARHGVFDSLSLDHMIKQVEKFVDRKRAAALCKVYSRICNLTTAGYLISEV